MALQPLDEFIPAPDVCERFTHEVDAPAAFVMDTAREFDMQSLPSVQAIFRLREVVTGSGHVNRAPRGLVTDMLQLGWGLLRDDPGRVFVAGAICQPWQPQVRFRPIAPGAFLTHSEPDHVKIAWTLETTPLGDARCRFSHETRVVATDEAARVRFRRYWRWARVGIVAIRWIMLPAIARRAEQRYLAAAVPPRRDTPGA